MSEFTEESETKEKTLSNKPPVINDTIPKNQKSLQISTKPKPDPPITPFSLVGMAWALASKEDGNNSKSAQDYLLNLIKNYEKDLDAQKFFKEIMPILYGVVAKLSYAREQATASFNRIEDIKKNQLNGLEQLSGLGTSLQGIISRTVGVVAGGSIGFLSSFGQSDQISVPISTLLGIAIGYGVIEISLQIYKIVEGRRIIKTKWSSKEATWDREFTLETHRASLLLYRKAGKAIGKIYKKQRNRVRHESKDFQMMTEMFMQKPSIEHSSAAQVIDFLRVCTEIEWQMAEFINMDNKLKQKFASSKNPEHPEKVDPFFSGFKGLSSFLLSEKIIDDDLYANILKIRKRRIKLFFHDDYRGFDIESEKTSTDDQKNTILLAPKVLDSIITTLEKHDPQKPKND